MTNETNTGQPNDNNWLGDILKIIAVGLGVYAGGKIINNAVTDNKREPLLQHLPNQDLSWLDNIHMRGFFRDRNFYVSQFPTTPSKDFVASSKILYWMLKYLGAAELQKNWYTADARDKLWWMCKRETLQEIDQLKGQTLETIFNSPLIKRLFSLPPTKRVDVEIYDAKPNPIQLLQEIREEFWTPGGLYSYLDNAKFVIHIYDIDLADYMISSDVFDENQGYPEQIRDFFNLPLPQNGVSFEKWCQIGRLRIIDKILPKDHADKVWKKSQILHDILTPNAGRADIDIISIVEHFDDVYLVSSDADTLHSRANWIDNLMKKKRNQIKYPFLIQIDTEKIRRHSLTPLQALNLIEHPPATGLPLFLIDTNLFFSREESLFINNESPELLKKKYKEIMDLWNIHFLNSDAIFYVTHSILGEFGIQPYMTWFSRIKGGKK